MEIFKRKEPKEQTPVTKVGVKPPETKIGKAEPAKSDRETKEDEKRDELKEKLDEKIYGRNMFATFAAGFAFAGVVAAIALFPVGLIVLPVAAAGVLGMGMTAFKYNLDATNAKAELEKFDAKKDA